MAITELNGSPVLLTPRRRRASSWPIASQTRANTNGFDTLWIENADGRVADAEQRARRIPATHTPNEVG